MSTPDSKDLGNLYLQRSKHASYQLVHPLVAPHMPDIEGLPAGKLEIERQAYFDRSLPLSGARVLDIGANTGYFSFGALHSGASHITCYEGNVEHATFVTYAAKMAGLSDKLTMNACYFDFLQPFEPAFDVTYCLNVLHHLGDDFGDDSLGIDAARTQMLRCLNYMASITRTLMLQLGFNWKGDIRHPLFLGGEKAALIAFVTQGSADHWMIEEITVPHPVTRVYESISEANLPRNNRIGEFMNRPLFKLRSKVLAG
ncbi:MAG: class I SAM-dependent methyltransferase [Sterolibacterium sp.]